jgi:hypothetical protein
VAISESSKDYLQTLRKKISSKSIPTTKEALEQSLAFIKENEKKFMNWMRHRRKGAE